jgi:menaquinol-cytochrome c reductase iron-sulfur subunit
MFLARAPGCGPNEAPAAGRIKSRQARPLSSPAFPQNFVLPTVVWNIHVDCGVYPLGMKTRNSPEQIDRREFFKKSIALALGAIAALLPACAAFIAVMDPLRRKSSTNGAVRITNLDAVPNDGLPHKFPVLASRTDAWNKFANAPIGAVYLRKLSNGQVEALNVVCPHAGCFVDFRPESGNFLCPCHKSSFKVDGTIADKASPSPRGLDSLTAEVRADGGVWVQFQNFQAGRPDKIPAA